ncbi:MAG: S-methyl-5-thioribose-1-phosphate isomerase [Candidatus Cloacimonadaceae bacterium]|jgi:S-methyl-5-thioribose-1-phosphate isomerase|nr:S-methyl-5-thioribose-1-phosphate isomerase [Candidatus Cloacimonadota bacterium]MDX9949985.1 S-methyl-5-thioribose-1-phosphate isomerase [Candidatus Syntrophosphaera sp.]NLN85625.1 S-methyl-5-thioribose-1-phosphate isomerase [Candidatus Cloacimonadota bacterium]
MIINGKEYTSVWWENGRLHMIDQNRIPQDFTLMEFTDHLQVADAIRNMNVRGAPAIGAAAAFAMALAAQNATDQGFRGQIRKARELLISTRPTAVDLQTGVNHVYEQTIKFIPNLTHARQVALLSAKEFAKQSAEDCRLIGEQGLHLVPDGSRILTHCNAGALATVDWGTALAVLRLAHRKGRNIFVYVSETRPRHQGSKITAWELEQEGIPHAIIPDSASGFYFWKKEIDLVITGADRVCLNGDIANKIGTYDKAVLAHHHNIPFYIAAPLSTFDFSCAQGSGIPIEFRDASEITYYGGQITANPGSDVLNPGFDITPASLITGIVTPKGVFAPAEAAQKVQE